MEYDIKALSIALRMKVYRLTGDRELGMHNCAVKPHGSTAKEKKASTSLVLSVSPLFIYVFIFVLQTQSLTF